MLGIGRVFSTSFAMFRRRFWALVGMWAVFFAIQIAGSAVFGIAMVVFGMTGMAALDTGLDSPAAIAGMGIGMILVLVLFYAAYVVILLAQQAAMVTLASPLEEPAFGAALGRGFKSALPFLAITVILMLGYFLIAGVIGGVAGAAGGGSVVSAVLALLSLPVLVYLACRLAVLIPVVAVEQVFNPIAAIRRSWAVTRGKAGDVFLALLAFVAVSLVALCLPFAVIFGGLLGSQDNDGAAAGFAIVGVLLFIPLFIAYTILAAAFTAALHSELTGSGAEALGEVFA